MNLMFWYLLWWRQFQWGLEFEFDGEVYSILLRWLFLLLFRAAYRCDTCCSWGFWEGRLNFFIYSINSMILIESFLGSGFAIFDGGIILIMGFGGASAGNSVSSSSSSEWLSEMSVDISSEEEDALNSVGGGLIFLLCAVFFCFVSSDFWWTSFSLFSEVFLSCHQVLCYFV